MCVSFLLRQSKVFTFLQLFFSGRVQNMELATILARRRSINTAGGEVVIESGGNGRSLSNTSDFKVGARVQARFAGGDDYFAGVVSGLGRDGTVDVDYDDGDIERGVPPSLVRLECASSFDQVDEMINFVKSHSENRKFSHFFSDLCSPIIQNSVMNFGSTLLQQPLACACAAERKESTLRRPCGESRVACRGIN